MTDTAAHPRLAVCASRHGYACVLRTGASEVTVDAATDLAAAIAGLCQRTATPPDRIDSLWLDVGPGSYTGLRVATTFARTLQELCGWTIHTATSIELLALWAWHRPAAAAGAVVRPVLDARRGRVHHAPVALRKQVELLAAPRATLPALLTEAGDGEVWMVEASVAETVAPIAAERGCRVAPVELPPGLPLARLLLDDRLRPRVARGTDLRPLYLMGSYADAGS